MIRQLPSVAVVLGGLALVAGCSSGSSSPPAAPSSPATAASSPAAPGSAPSSPSAASSNFTVVGPALHGIWTLTCLDQTELTSLNTLTLELNRASGIPTDIGFNGLTKNGTLRIPTNGGIPALDLTYDTSGNSKHWVANGGAQGSNGTVTVSHNGSAGSLHVTFVPEKVSGNTASGKVTVTGSWNCPPTS